MNDQAIDRILNTVKRKLPRITLSTRTRYSSELQGTLQSNGNYNASHEVPEQGTALEKPTKPENYQIRRAKRNTRRGVSQGVYQAALNDQTVVDRILTTVKRKLPRITRSTRTRYSSEKNRQTREEYQLRKSEKKHMSRCQPKSLSCCSERSGSQ